jgi:hypothetical protein
VIVASIAVIVVGGLAAVAYFLHANPRGTR